MSSAGLQFNSAAKQLIEWDQPPTGGVGAGEGAPAAAPSSAAPKQPEAKKNTKKRHSFTSLTTASKASQATQQRHSMEISPPVLISSSNPTAAARIGELAGLSCSAPSQVPALPSPGATAVSAFGGQQLSRGKALCVCGWKCGGGDQPGCPQVSSVTSKGQSGNYKMAPVMLSAFPIRRPLSGTEPSRPLKPHLHPNWRCRGHNVGLQLPASVSLTLVSRLPVSVTGKGRGEAFSLN